MLTKVHKQKQWEKKYYWIPTWIRKLLSPNTKVSSYVVARITVKFPLYPPFSATCPIRNPYKYPQNPPSNPHSRPHRSTPLILCVPIQGNNYSYQIEKRKRKRNTHTRCSIAKTILETLDLSSQGTCNFSQFIVIFSLFNFF